MPIKKALKPKHCCAVYEVYKGAKPKSVITRITT